MQMKGQVYRFAGFVLDPVTGELRTGESSTTLQEKPLLLLQALLDHPQQVVSREQLRARMWSNRTVVEFDQGINAAIKKVRDALGDPVARPRYIETVAKKGYRLLVPVTLEPGTGERGSPAEPAAPPRSRHLRWAVPLAAAVAVAVAWLHLGGVAGDPRTEIRSLAVLPLQDLSPDGAHEYFADGVTEEITTNLAQTLSLRVISRTSVMRYKRTTKPVSQIARELGVQAIVEGSVARDGDRVSVTVQLIDAVRDRHLWAEKYNRKAEDILAIEAEVAQAVASQITGTLSRDGAAQRVVRRVDPRVHELCLLGRYHLSRRTAADLARAQDYFQQAIALDAAHAPAHAGLADVHALQPFYGVAKFAESSPLAEAAARRALALDASLAEAHATLGLLRISSRDWARSADDFRRALALNPNYASAHHWYSYYLRFANRLEEACAELEIARQLDPLSAAINADLGEVLNAAQRYPEARVSLRRAIELAPEFARPYALLSVTELAMGQSAAAVELSKKALDLDPRAPAIIAQAAFALAVNGDATGANALLRTLRNLALKDINVSMYVAMVEAGLGHRDEALASLEAQARSPESVVLQGIQHWYAFQGLRAEPRFRSLLSQAW
jgi:TolB-like protein/DNA-binding winged helix-turn-helix (wHTH) protein/Tfp pilus assembly protein PilF